MKTQNKETRYYIDLDLKAGKILGWDYDQRAVLVKHEIKNPSHQRIYFIKGQYNKPEKKILDLTG